MKRGKWAFILLGMMALQACVVESNYIDSHKFENGMFSCYSEGEKYEFDLRYFKLCEGDFVFNDTIFLDEAVQTANTGFVIERDELISKRYAGNYEICRFHYKAAFIVYIASYIQKEEHYLPFEFEAEEVWLNGEPVTKLPLVFEKRQTDLSEEALSEDDEGLFKKFILNFPMSVYYRYDGKQLSEFNYLYKVAVKNEVNSDYYVSSDLIDIEVNYDYHP